MEIYFDQKSIVESMKAKYKGRTRVKSAQLQRLRRIFETLEMKTRESVSDYFGRVMETTNYMSNCRENMNDVKIVEKILRSVTENFNFVVCSIEEYKDIDLLNVEEINKVKNKFFKLSMTRFIDVGFQRGGSSYVREWKEQNHF